MDKAKVVAALRMLADFDTNKYTQEEMEASERILRTLAERIERGHIRTVSKPDSSAWVHELILDWSPDKGSE